MPKRSAVRKVDTPLALVPTEPLKLDFGCGPNKRAGFQGVDQYQFVGVDHILDVRQTPWPWADNSVSEAHASHFIEHLTGSERVTFCNELYRVLQPGASCQIVVPHWNSCRAFGDFTHQWPPVSEFWFFYLGKDWRMVNAPHNDAQMNPNGYACNFAASWGHNLHPSLGVRNEEYRQFAVQWYKEAAQDLCATITAIKA